MSFALLGVMAMQLYFLVQSYDMQSKVFDRSVKEALDNVVTKLSRRDADKFLTRKARHRNDLKNQFNAVNAVEISEKPDLRYGALIINDSAQKVKKPLLHVQNNSAYYATACNA
ncbi:hypothetical protein [Mucilaginibacter antarcticus]|uniref:hypothetical protein n=1 Tax=Mucilaginibacter antarcticus TaxID=1855725 RepID=UPI0036331DA4